jgi:hypothetical protein
VLSTETRTYNVDGDDVVVVDIVDDDNNNDNVVVVVVVVVVVQWPDTHNTAVQHNTASNTWHVPFESGNETRKSFQPPQTWFCLREVLASNAANSTSKSRRPAVSNVDTDNKSRLSVAELFSTRRAKIP